MFDDTYCFEPEKSNVLTSAVIICQHVLYSLCNLQAVNELESPHLYVGETTLLCRGIYVCLLSSRIRKTSNFCVGIFLHSKWNLKAKSTEH